MSEPDWTVLLIGGASATGKTTLGEALARHFDARYVDADLFWIVLQRALPAEIEPALHLYEPDSVWLLPTEELVRRYFRMSAYVCQALEPVIAHHHIIDRRAVIEGVWLMPSFVMQQTYAGYAVADLRSVFLSEPDEAEIAGRIAARPTPWYLQQPPEIQRGLVKTDVAYGEELIRQAKALSLPVLESRPFDTLFERAVAALDHPAS